MVSAVPTHKDLERLFKPIYPMGHRDDYKQSLEAEVWRFITRRFLMLLWTEQPSYRKFVYTIQIRD